MSKQYLDKHNLSKNTLELKMIKKIRIPNNLSQKFSKTKFE